MTYRIWPAFAVAALALVGASAAVAVGAGSETDCAAGRDWVVVTPLDQPDAERTVLADYRHQLAPLFRACVDVDDLPRLDPAEIPDPRS